MFVTYQLTKCERSRHLCNLKTGLITPFFFAIYINSNSLDTFLEWQLNFCYWINLRNFHVANTRLYSDLKNARKTIKIYVMKFFIIFSSCCLYSMGLLFMTKELKFKIFTKADDGWVDVKKSFLLCISLQIKSITYSTRVSWFFFWDKLFFFIFRFIDKKKVFKEYFMAEE